MLRVEVGKERPNRRDWTCVSLMGEETIKTIAIGHSEGDRCMLEEADISIGFNSEVLDLGQYDVKSVDEILDIIEKNS